MAAMMVVAVSVPRLLTAGLLFRVELLRDLLRNLLWRERAHTRTDARNTAHDGFSEIDEPVTSLRNCPGWPFAYKHRRGDWHKLPRLRFGE
jgi:hypothetical protein